MKLILFGPQGAGKGTIGEKLSKHYKIPLLGTGDILRGAAKELTELGKMADIFMKKGELVPDQLISDIINERVGKDDCKNGFILDGFPRTLKQAELFGDRMDEIDYMIELDAPEEILLKRLTNRRICRECGAVYNIHPDCDPNPKEEGKCDACGGELYQRSDDTEEPIKKRLNTYHEETKQILDKFKDKVKKVDSSDDPQAIFKRIIDIIG
jgi:adenylate kinase